MGGLEVLLEKVEWNARHDGYSLKCVHSTRLLVLPPCVRFVHVGLDGILLCRWKIELVEPRGDRALAERVGKMRSQPRVRRARDGQETLWLECRSSGGALAPCRDRWMGGRGAEGAAGDEEDGGSVPFVLSPTRWRSSATCCRS